MAGSGVSAGHQTRANYYWEDSFASTGTLTDTTAKVPGSNTTVGTASGRNNLRRVFQPGSREAMDIIATIFDGAFALEFTVTNFWWLRMFLGSPSTADNGDGSHTHTYDGVSPESFRLVEGYEQDGKQRYLYGCVASQLDLSVTVGNEIRVTIRGGYADSEIVTEALTAQATPTEDTMTFAEAAASIGGTTEGYIQNMTASLQANVDMVREIGSRIPIDFNEKTLEPDFDFSKIHEGDTDNLEAMYGGSTTVQEQMDNTASVDVTMDNGSAAGSGINKSVWTLSGTLPDNYDEQGIGDPRADLEETMTRVATAMNCTVTNETATAP